MAKYEAAINLTLELDAETDELAEKAIYGEFMDRLLNTASRDAQFKLWAEVIEITEIEGN